MAAIKWRRIQCPAREVNLAVLGLGQSFRWRKVDSGCETVWQGVMANRVWQLKRKEEDQLYFRVLAKFSRCQPQDDESVLGEYFQLDKIKSLQKLYAEWSSVDPYFASVADRITGIRVLRQEPVECLFSFICSTNNNIKRISGMVETLCRLYGEAVSVDQNEATIDRDTGMVSIDQKERSIDRVASVDQKLSSIGSKKSIAHTSSINQKRLSQEQFPAVSTEQTFDNAGKMKRSRYDEPVEAVSSTHDIPDLDQKHSVNRVSGETTDLSCGIGDQSIDNRSQASRQSITISRQESATFYDFPTVTSLAHEDVEAVLRANGFGYRAKYIAATAKMLLDEFKSEDGILEKLNNLRLTGDRKETVDFLLKLQGVGPKVADCVALMSMDKTDAVPIDTHVRKITGEKYMPALAKAGSLTSKLYDDIGDFYRKLFGDYAGWAHSVLFSAQVSKE